MTSNNYKKIFHLVFSYFLIFLPFAAIMIFGYASSDPLEYRFYHTCIFYKKMYQVYFHNIFTVAVFISLIVFSVKNSWLWYKKQSADSLVLLYFINSFLLGLFGVFFLLMLLV